MRHHYRLSDTKQQYRHIFEQARLLLETRMAALRDGFQCQTCDDDPELAPTDRLTKAHPDCGYQPWREAALGMIEAELGGEILQRLQQIEAYKNTFSCHMCGVCCRIASSDASYEELKSRARAGDEFSSQFISVFLPYASREKAQEKFPDVVEAVLAEQDKENPVYFYHCPYVGEDNRCSIFGSEKRPGICASYPETPLSYIYEKCAWQPWKAETHTDTLMAHALLALCTDWAERLKLALKA